MPPLDQFKARRLGVHSLPPTHLMKLSNCDHNVRLNGANLNLATSAPHVAKHESDAPFGVRHNVGASCLGDYDSSVHA